MMRGWGAALTLMWTCSCLAGQVQVENIRTWPAPDNTRVVFDIDGPVDHTLFMLKNPGRVVLDLRGAHLAADLPKPEANDRLLQRLRAATRKDGVLRVVLDLKSEVRPKSFQLKPNSQYGHRLVIDLQSVDEAAASAETPSKKDVPARLRDIIVAIDPGHGGEDPGATGRSRTKEKDVVLAIAKRLKTRIDREPGMRAVLTRDGDYFLGLRRRLEIARRHGADLFVSLHADAFSDPRVNGSSVYILSRNGASSEAARWLAEQENASDLIGGVSLDDKDELLASVLLDLSQTATISASTEVARSVLQHLRSVGKTHKKNVERAGFMVLKSPDIPSILVEADFISNPKVERMLNNGSHQTALADAMVRGVREYFKRNAPPNTLFAQRKHVITRGDTLSAIAVRYRTSVAALRNANRIDGSDIREGEVLTIPYASGS
ncbi:MAG: N-acetylmuramoyl-L-alanine amidase [Gammaproteobacteria bacterium]|nr:N-acetylmuramoyl-L-alanine amidase [Gammaproteobacteria bacterium]